MSKNVLLAGFSLLAFVGGNAYADHLVAIAGPKAALSYLANVDPNVRRALLANGLAEKPSQRKARIAAEAVDAPTKNVRPAQIVRCPEGSTWDGKGCWAKNLKAVSR